MKLMSEPEAGDTHDRLSPSRDYTLDRRRFLQSAAAAGLGGVAAGLLAGAENASAATAQRKRPARAKKGEQTPAVEPVTLAPGVTAPSARWLVEENKKPGTTNWVVTGVQQPHELEGYASQVSAVPGDEITLFVNTTSPTVAVQAYRMGYYQGLGGRLVYQSDTVAGGQQPAAVVGAGNNTVECVWNPTLQLKLDASWPPGCYLLKLVGNAGQQQYIPLTVRDDSSHAAYVLQNSVTTWQAYNLWGNYSLYYGQNASGGSDFADRARIVSFDRPYPQTWAQGAADFMGNEFPLLFQMESLGLDMTYWTDVDLHANPQLLSNHRCLFSLGHDEYWSLQMRNGALSALKSGVNFAFLGANACYRQIRMQPSQVGPNRQQICYKDATEDPLYGVNNEVVTAPAWESPPTNWPESELIGAMYQSVGADDNLVVADASSWFFNGCGLTNGQQLPSVVQGEYDRYVPSLPGPTNVDVFAHSTVAGQGNWSDISYYTVPNGGGVLASGNASFIYKLSNTTAFPTGVVPAAIPGVTDILLRAMLNVYGTFGNGPAAEVQPSSSNWQNVYQGSAASVGSAAGTPSA
jgi:hypothetical protein